MTTKIKASLEAKWDQDEQGLNLKSGLLLNDSLEYTRLSDWTLDMTERAIRERLCSMGWLPPDGKEKALEVADLVLQGQSIETPPDLAEAANAFIDQYGEKQ